MDRTLISYNLNHIGQDDIGDIVIESLLSFPFSSKI